MKKSFAIFLALCMSLYSGNNIKTSDFQKWLTKTTNQLISAGEIINTSMGNVQIVTQGNGPPVLVLHGGFGGWDQGVLVAANLSKNGFKTIIPSRPGYLATPLSTNPLALPPQELTAAQQADIMAALINALHIPKVIVMGFSAGAPVAYEFGLNYPGLTSAVVLECIGANPDEDGLFYLFLGLALATETAEIDYGTYLLHLSLINDAYSSELEVLPADTNLTGNNLNARNAFVVNHINQYAFLRNMLIATIPLSPRLLGTLNDFMGIDFWTTTFLPPPPISQYSLPTLIIQAVDDSNGYYPTAQTVNSQLPTSQLISVPNSGHFIWLGPNANAWQTQLIAFLKANSP